MNDFCGDLSSEKVFVFDDRSSKIILTAPHATRTFPNHAVKKSDLFTGAIVLHTGELCNTSTIVRIKFEDNNNSISSFVSENDLSAHFFLDIHGMADNEKFDLAVGTGLLEEGAYQKELELISVLAEKYGIRFVINFPKYCGIGAGKLTTDLQKQTGKAQILQLEWGRRFRDFESNPKTVTEKTIPFLQDLVSELNMP